MVEWRVCFQEKMPVLSTQDFEKALETAKVRPFSQLSWESLHDKFVNAIDAQNPNSVIVTIASSDDPSILAYITYFLLILRYQDCPMSFQRERGLTS